MLKKKLQHQDVSRKKRHYNIHTKTQFVMSSIFFYVFCSFVSVLHLISFFVLMSLCTRRRIGRRSITNTGVTKSGKFQSAHDERKKTNNVKQRTKGAKQTETKRNETERACGIREHSIKWSPWSCFALDFIISAVYGF